MSNIFKNQKMIAGCVTYHHEIRWGCLYPSWKLFRGSLHQCLQVFPRCSQENENLLCVVTEQNDNNYT